MFASELNEMYGKTSSPNLASTLEKIEILSRLPPERITFVQR